MDYFLYICDVFYCTRILYTKNVPFSESEYILLILFDEDGSLQLLFRHLVIKQCALLQVQFGLYLN